MAALSRPLKEGPSAALFAVTQNSYRQVFAFGNLINKLVMTVIHMCLLGRNCCEMHADCQSCKS